MELYKCTPGNTINVNSQNLSKNMAGQPNNIRMCQNKTTWHLGLISNAFNTKF